MSLKISIFRKGRVTKLSRNPKIRISKRKTKKFSLKVLGACRWEISQGTHEIRRWAIECVRSDRFAPSFRIIPDFHPGNSREQVAKNSGIFRKSMKPLARFLFIDYRSVFVTWIRSLEIQPWFYFSWNIFKFFPERGLASTWLYVSWSAARCVRFSTTRLNWVPRETFHFSLVDEGFPAYFFIVFIDFLELWQQ